MKVYLSGGMNKEWPERVKREVPGLTYIDPIEHGLEMPTEYAAWDLLGVRQADVVFAYMEDDNPSGVGLALGIGYAKGLGKTTILVDNTGLPHLQIVRAAVDVWRMDLDAGILFLQSLERMNA